MSTTRFAVVCLPLALLLVACGGQDGDAPGEVPRLTIGHVGHDHHISLYVAALAPDTMRERCGVWLKEKKPREVFDLMDGDTVVAEVHLKKVGGGSNMPAAMERGEIQVGLGGIPAVVKYVDKGSAFRILTPLNVDGDMLLVRPDFPADEWDGFVDAVRNSDRPIKIGYKAPVAVAKLVFMGALDAAGIPYSDNAPAEKGVWLVNLQGGKKIVPSLEAGGVDGAVINEPFGSIAVHKKVGKVVSLLADLPPDGRWRSHPCCCVCATESAIAANRDAVKALLKMLHSTTGFISENREEAVRLASAWTKQPEAVESMSVPNIVYVREADSAYRVGLETWFGMMNDLGQFSGRLKDLSYADAFALCHDLSLLEEVAAGR